MTVSLWLWLLLSLMLILLRVLIVVFFRVANCVVFFAPFQNVSDPRFWAVVSSWDGSAPFLGVASWR